MELWKRPRLLARSLLAILVVVPVVEVFLATAALSASTCFCSWRRSSRRSTFERISPGLSERAQSCGRFRASGKTVLFWNTHASQLASPERPDARKLPEALRVYFRGP